MIWLTGESKVAQRTRDRRKGESRKDRVLRHAAELAGERQITQKQALAVLRTGNPLAQPPGLLD